MANKYYQYYIALSEEQKQKLLEYIRNYYLVHKK